MSKKVAGYENFRVVIEPRALGNFGYLSVSDGFVCRDASDIQKRYQERCDEITEQVKRHVDNVGSVRVDFDTLTVCSHCGASWTETSPDYNGGCCDADEANNPEVTQ